MIAPPWNSSAARLAGHIALLLVVIGLALGSAAGPASASRAPTAAERTQISAAVHNSPLTAHVQDSAYTVANVRISTVSPWARAMLVARRPTIQSAVTVLSRSPAGWRLRDLGSADVGCGIAPVAVLTDLGLGCPPPPVTRACASFTVPGLIFIYQIRATRVNCVTARSVARSFAALSRTPAGWRCTGDRYNRFACTRGSSRIAFRGRGLN